jgi:hypothetical protein
VLSARSPRENVERATVNYAVREMSQYLDRSDVVLEYVSGNWL